MIRDIITAVCIGYLMGIAPAVAAYMPGPLLPSDGGFTPACMDTSTTQNVGGIKTFLAAIAFTTSLKTGSSGTPITHLILYLPSLSMAAVGAHTALSRSSTVTGMSSIDTVITVNPPGNTAGLGIVRRSSSADTLGLGIINVTAASKTPPIGTYRVLVAGS